MRNGRAVTIIGIGDDGCVGLPARAVNAVAQASVLVGGERHLAFFPEFAGERISWKGGLDGALDRVAEAAAEENVCVLASGDPMFFGIGRRVVERIGAGHVEVIPHPSSVQWAFARVGLPWEDASFLSFHGRPAVGFLTRLKRLRKAACLTDPTNTPRALATRMRDHGETDWNAWVCENLGGPGERVRPFAIDTLAGCGDVGPLNVLVLARRDPDWRPPPAVSFLHEDAFAKRMPKKGLITKREIRMLSLASLAIRPDAVVWDIGAGSGSVSIEAAYLAPEGRVFAVEIDPEGVSICRENCRTHAVDNVEVIEGRAPEVLADLPDPDAVFVGGSKGSLPAIVASALDRLRPGGRLVVNAVTMENVAEAYRTFREAGIVPDVTLLQVSRGAPLARYLRYEALNPIHSFAVARPVEGNR